MRRLFLFEWKKTWYGKRTMLPITFGVILILWFIANGNPLRDVLNGKSARANEEMKPFWGQTMTEELRETARLKAISYGAQETEDGLLRVEKPTDPSDAERYEWANTWRVIAMEPTLEEQKENYDACLDAYKEMLENGTFSEAYYRYMTRGGKDPAIPEFAPSVTAWRYWLNSEGYELLIAGVAVIGLIFLLLGNLFSREEDGGLREISLSKPLSRKWIGAKILVAAASGALVAFSLYSGLLLFFGIVYGFQGWNISALSYTAGGSVYGLMYHSVNALQLAGLRLGLFVICGAFMGVFTAACSAVVRQTLPAIGSAAGLCLVMESLLYAVAIWRQSLASAVQYQYDWTLLECILTTPVRAFLNMEILTTSIPSMTSGYSNLMMHNILISPDLCALYLGIVFGAILLCAALCYGYQRQR